MKLLRAIALVAWWNIAVDSLFTSLPPLYGGPLMAAAALLFYRRYLVGRKTSTPGPLSYRNDVALTPLGSSLSWVLAATLIFVLGRFPLVALYMSVVPDPADSPRMVELLSRPYASWAFAVGTMVVAPILEEYLFRGLIQPALVRRTGAIAGICITAGLFAMLHSITSFPLTFTFGVATGVLVYRTASLWSSILLHAAANATGVSWLWPDSILKHPAGILWTGTLIALSLAALVAFVLCIRQITPVVALAAPTPQPPDAGTGVAPATVQA